MSSVQVYEGDGYPYVKKQMSLPDIQSILEDCRHVLCEGINWSYAFGVDSSASDRHVELNQEIADFCAYQDLIQSSCWANIIRLARLLQQAKGKKQGFRNGCTEEIRIEILKKIVEVLS